MSVKRIASRYAKSLFDSAVEQHQLSEILADIKSFQLISKEEAFSSFLKNPIIPVKNKLGVVKELFEGKFNPLTLSFLHLVFEKRRETVLPEIAEEFINLYRASKNISSMKLVTAAPLSQEVLDAIKNKLADGMTGGGTLEIATEVDDALIGGFVADFGDKMYNASVAQQLRELKRKFQ